MEDKQVKKDRRKYDSEFKQEVLKMLETGRSVSDISRSLGISDQLIYGWKRRNNGKEYVDKNENNMLVEVEKITLQKRIKELEQERDILKKALGIFSRTM
ncbi:MAG: transposase [Chitinophagaceae bacterium]